VADHYVRDESCAKSTERSLGKRGPQVRRPTKTPVVKGSQELPLTRSPGRDRKPGSWFFKRKGERKRDYHEHPYWFGQGTIHSQL
jgi:hypothetical protein